MPIITIEPKERSTSAQEPAAAHTTPKTARRSTPKSVKVAPKRPAATAVTKTTTATKVPAPKPRNAPRTRLKAAGEEVHMSERALLADLTDACVQGGSRRAMNSAMNVINKYMHDNKFELNRENFFRFLHHCRKSKKLSIARYASHLQNWLRLNGLENWAGHPDILSFAGKAERLNHKSHAVAKGSLTIRMFDKDVRPWMEAKERPEIEILYIEAAIHLRFRGVQMRQLLYRHLTSDDDSGSGYSIRFANGTQKAQRVNEANAIAKVSSRHLLSTTDLELLLNVIDQRCIDLSRDVLRASDYLFPRKATRGNRSMDIHTAISADLKECSTDSNWCSDVVWSMHCTKHGGVEDLHAMITDLTTAYLTGISVGNIRTYNNSNEKRQASALLREAGLSDRLSERGL